jgi:uncharacterized protein (DUF849 family)
MEGALMRDAVVLTCALSGVVANKQQCPAIPYTPDEYGEEARRAYEAGACQVHIHARTPDGAPSFETRDYAAIRDAIVARCPDILINFSTGAVGVSVEQRTGYLRALRPHVGALNMGSMNYAKYSERNKRFVFSFVFQNPFDEILSFLSAMEGCDIVPEMECFDSGHVASIPSLRHMGAITRKPRVSLILGVLGGAPATSASLAHLASLVPADGTWGVIGISRDQWMLAMAALPLGGDVRVGLEDNFYLPDGTMASSNGALVDVAARMVRDCGRRPATPGEARQLLGITR